jgi:leucine dehydrogenase
MSVFSLDAFDDHEQVIFCRDPDTGLKAIIAVHSTVMGPSVGGCRMWNYASEEEALRDVLRLSRGMSFKNAMANLGLGGGKSVIIGDSATDKTPALLRSFGKFLESLGGKYITAEDVGMSVADMDHVAEKTKFVAGREVGDTPSGDPSPCTAHGVFVGIKACVKQKMGLDELGGLKVAIQGVGHVGYNLAKELAAAGAILTVADINELNVARVVADFGATAVATDQILLADVDIIAPCAMGAGLNDNTIPALHASIIAGSANNQLAEDRHGQMLTDRGILYAPDYIINAGGIMNVANEVHHRAITPEQGMKDVEVIYDTLLEVFKAAETANEPTATVADRLALGRIAEAKAAKKAKKDEHQAA